MVKQTFPLKYTGLATFLLLITACELPQMEQPKTSSPETIYTIAAETIAAQITGTAEVATSTQTPEPPTQPPVVTDTPMPPTMTPSSSNTLEATPTSTTALESTPIQEAIYEDDFSNPMGWYTADEEDFSFTYVDGSYQIINNLLNAAVWSIREQEFNDVSLEVDVSYAGGSEDGYIGLLCRFSEEGENYYAFVVGVEGFYGIAKREDGEFNFIEQGQDEGGVLERGDSRNRVRADCIGNNLTLSVNGQDLLQVQDDSFDSGIVGLVAGTRLSGAGLIAQFDNFAIYLP